MNGIRVFLKIVGAVVASIVVMFALFIFQDPIEAWFAVPASRAGVLFLVLWGYVLHKAQMDKISILQKQIELLGSKIDHLRNEQYSTQSMIIENRIKSRT